MRRALEIVPVALFVITLFVVVKYASMPLRNNDTYFHLRFGAEFLDGWGLRDPGTVTPFATREWLPTQWAPEIAMAWFERTWGLAGVSWLTGTWSITFAVAAYVAARRQAPALAASAVVLMVLAAAHPALSARPQVLSYVLVLVFTVAWLDSVRDGLPRWWLVPLTWVWACVHGMWPLAIVVGLVGVAGAFLERQHSGRDCLRLLAVPLLCAVAAAFTPVGPGLYGAVAQVGAYSHYFAEWASPDFQHSMAILTGATVGVTFLLRLRQPSAMPWGELGLLLLAAGATLYSFRTLPVAVAIVTPILAASLAPYLAPQPVRRWERVTIAGAVLASLIALAISVPSTSARVPDWMAAELGALPEDTVVLNDSEWGGYLMYEFPQLDIVSHGYGDAFTEAELERLEDIYLQAPEWDRLLADTGATVAVIRPDGPLFYALQHDLGWKEVVREGNAVVVLRAPSSS